MQVTIRTSDRGRVRVRHMPDEDVAQLVESFREQADPVLTVVLDSQAAVHIARRHIVRIDVDEERPSPGGDA